ncbi:uncharacterized protein LOC108032831 [Drosophila biarmipes]|uniref:uncharacterized protein LOC108032831 n=1 Tax=Drosophila biarmipes TaxID=125945 RepID=UPI0007E6EC2D|nr:uncharacterized protein LOC108032831 [Drosophila biarmipes]
MNPTCRVDINEPECQQWMAAVYAKCRDLFGTESLPLWWVNDTPAVYKADVAAMTVADCHRLKRQLAVEVADEEEDLQLDNVGLGRMVALFVACGAILMLAVLLCGMKCQGARAVQAAEAKAARVEPQEDPPDLNATKKRNKTAKCKSWMRRSCRRFFLHNESQIRRSQANAEREVAVRNERTRQNIAMWTNARERDAQKKREKLQRSLEKASKKKALTAK